MLYSVMPLEMVLEEEDLKLEWKEVGNASLLVERLEDGSFRLERIVGAPVSMYLNYLPGDILNF